MSWRRFLILIRGLSHNSVLLNFLQNQKKQNANVVENPDDIEKAMKQIGW